MNVIVEQEVRQLIIVQDSQI